MQTLLESTILSFTAMLALSATLIMNAQPANADTVDILNTSLVSRSATGFYGLDESGNPIPDRAGIMLVFDYPIVLDSVSTDDFWVQTDDGAYADVIEIQVCDNFVFLKLANELVPSATPAVGMNDNEYVEFDVGNSVERLFFTEIDIHDGIPPTLAMSLSGGSGTGTGDEGPDRLTKDKIHITVTSDEPLDSPPLVTVVCNNIQWTGPVDADVSQLGFDNFIANRSGQLTEPQSSNPDSLNDQSPDHLCGNDQNIALTTHPMIVNSATSWTYEWRNQTESPHKLSDGLLTAIAHARDRSEYRHHYTGETIHNWSVTSADFDLDTILISPLEIGDGDVRPTHGSTTYIRRPRVLIRFDDPARVTLNSIEFDGFEVASDVRVSVEKNEFVYWPLEMEFGEHRVVGDATDAAGNNVEFMFGFTSSKPDPFILRLQPGWNAISIPARPLTDDFESLFHNPAIRSVVQWRGGGVPDPWAMVLRRNGVWTGVNGYDDTINFYPFDGIWVYATEETKQIVELRYIPYVPGGPVTLDLTILDGWYHVGITQLGYLHLGDQFGRDLTDSKGNSISARDYLGARLAYRWDSGNQRLVTLEPHDPVKLGEALWVFFPEPDVLP